MMTPMSRFHARPGLPARPEAAAHLEVFERAGPPRPRSRCSGATRERLPSPMRFSPEATQRRGVIRRASVASRARADSSS